MEPVRHARVNIWVPHSGFAAEVRVLKSIPCKVCSVFDQSLDGEGIGNLASS